ncbi:hypothetical protein Tco_0913209 [Tanacetum coccineum]
MEEINNFQQEPDENLYQAWERFKELLMKYPQHYLTEMQETAADAKSMEDTLSKYMSESAKRHEENSNLIKEIQASTDAAIRNQGASIKTLEIQIGQISKCYASLDYLNLGLGELAHTKLTVELADRTVKYPKGIAKNVLVGIGPFLSTARAKIDVYKRKITLRVEDEMIIFTSVKPTSSLIKRAYMLSLRERIELDLEARLMGETLVSEEDKMNGISHPYQKLKGFYNGVLNFRIRFTFECKDGRMAHTQAH